VSSKQKKKSLNDGLEYIKGQLGLNVVKKKKLGLKQTTINVTTRWVGDLEYIKGHLTPPYLSKLYEGVEFGTKMILITNGRK
jgi:hypothetical protein